MSKHEGLIRLSKVVYYLAVAISASILLSVLYIFATRESGADDATMTMFLLAFALVVYLIGKGIAWIIEGFAD
jgi:hypothetical protein